MPGLYIGTSGWNYDHWKNNFYDGIKHKDWLHYYAQQFNAVEVNATFYRLQEKTTFKRWHDETPPDFRFTLKGHRFVTHNKKLHDPVESIKLERDHALHLGAKLAVVVWQLPANFHKNMARLQTFFSALDYWPEVRHAMEFRHRSWFDEQVRAALCQAGIANCQSDAASWPLWTAVTTDLVYIRLHGHTHTYISAYHKNSLLQWASKIKRWREQKCQVYVYFDNDALAHATKDASRLRNIIAAQ